MGVKRKAVIKYKTNVVEKKFKVAKLAGGYHFHSCADSSCRQVYSCVCVTPEINGRCWICKRGEQTPDMAWKEPRDCCFGNCELLDPKDDWYRWLALAGPGPWYKCKECHRAHGWTLA